MEFQLQQKVRDMIDVSRHLVCSKPIIVNNRYFVSKNVFFNSFLDVSQI